MFLEGGDEVVEGGLEDGEEAEAHEVEADEGREPEDMAGGAPAKHEEAAGEEDRAEHHRGEAGFRDGLVVVGVEFNGVELIVAIKRG